MIFLKGGQLSNNVRLDRVRNVDIRSLNYPISDVLPGEAYRFRSNTWRLSGEVLDQGPDGACVGFGCAHELRAYPAEVKGVDYHYAMGIYWAAQRRDPWAGGAYPGATPVYEGTDVLSGLATLKDNGWCREYRWCLSIDDLVATLGFHGPVVLGIDWYDGMFYPDMLGYIKPTGGIAGGHCVLVNKVHAVMADGGARLDYLKTWIGGPNSWSNAWGLNGHWRMYLVDFMKLWPGADAGVLVGRKAGSVPATVDMSRRMSAGLVTA